MTFLRRNWIPIAASVFVTAVFVGVPFSIPRTGSNWPPSLGDWGDYIGGAMAMIAFIWLIAGHYETQRQLADANRDLALQSEATREVVAALATVAAASKLQVGEVFANAAPVFVPTSALAVDVNGVSFRVDNSSGYIAFRNDGALAKLVGVVSLEAHVSATLDGNRLCPTGGVFKLIVKSTKPMKQSGPITLVVSFDNKLGVRGWAKFTAKAVGELPSVELGHGQYPA